MSSNFSEISSFIWNVCDDVLRGLFKPHEYGDIILPFTVLRRLDCVLEPRKDEVVNLYEEYRTKVDDPTPIILNRINTTFFNHSQYDLNRLKSDPHNIYMNFNHYLGGFSENVVEIVENFQLEKPVEKLNKNNAYPFTLETKSPQYGAVQRIIWVMAGTIGCFNIIYQSIGYFGNISFHLSYYLHTQKRS